MFASVIQPTGAATASSLIRKRSLLLSHLRAAGAATARTGRHPRSSARGSGRSGTSGGPCRTAGPRDVSFIAFVVYTVGILRLFVISFFLFWFN